MTIPALFMGKLRVPVIAAPMFLVSGPELVVNACTAGIAGSFPSLNARTGEELDEWLSRIDADLTAFHDTHPDAPCAPYGINLIVNKSNLRLEQDLERVVRHRVPFVIASLGHPGTVLEAVHSYGGLVFSDVIHAYHARKAAEAGVDGIIAVAAGAGGHGGTRNPLSLIREIREFWQGTLILGGGISDGAGIRAAETAGADFAYMGTRFIATKEAMASEAYKQMLLDCTASDIVYTAAISGTNANFLRPSLEAAKIDISSPECLEKKPSGTKESARAWRDIWSAGHGVSTIHDVPPVRELAGRLEEEYRRACALKPSAAIA